MSSIKIPKNIYAGIEKPVLEDCYICLDSIGNEIQNGAILPYKCRHPICFRCLADVNKHYKNIDRFLNLANCGICRAIPNRYIITNKNLCMVPYSNKQSLYVGWSTVNEVTMFRDHIQHMLAHGTITEPNG